MDRAKGSLRSHHVILCVLAMTGWMMVAGSGCALVADVDFDAARLASPTSLEAGVFAIDGAVAVGVVPPDPESTCPVDSKKCNDACVSVTDPAYGCKAADCSPCSLAHTTENTCGIGGLCIPKGCAAGFDDCDHDPANGCETDLTRKETCGSCSTTCGTTTLCSPGGCVVDCPPPLIACGGSCVDTLASLAHCGGCDKPCAGGANADPTCAGSVCALACRAGFADCANTPAQACAPLPKWYVDGDSDGYGTPVFVEGCAQPAGHAATSGDCLDNNAAVHPNAPAAAVAFTGPNGPSFDYDCNGTEVEEGEPVHFPGCSDGCFEAGSLSTVPLRSGPGVNSYCGSSQVAACFVDIDPIYYTPYCSGAVYDSGDPIRCK